MWHLRLRDLKMAPTVTFLSHWSVGICCFLSDHWKGAKVQLYSFPFLCPLLQSVSYPQTELCRNNLWDNSVCLRVHTGSIKRCSFRKLPSVTVVSSSEGKQPVRNLSLKGWACWRTQILLIFFIMSGRLLGHATKRLAEKQHRSFKYLSYMLFFNRYMQVVLVFEDGWSSVKCRL